MEAMLLEIIIPRLREIRTLMIVPSLSSETGRTALRVTETDLRVSPDKKINETYYTQRYDIYSKRIMSDGNQFKFNTSNRTVVVI